MNIVELINKKRLNQSLSYDEIKFIINGYLSNEIKDYQISSLLMAICINGMNEEETYNLTDIMINSGNKIDLSSINGIKVDKHSTGGVGDKTTMIIGPLVASCGVPIAKMSGRGLGHTGGTIDKLESIEGFKVSLLMDEFINQVQRIGIAISSTSLDLVPADKRLYELRDVTGTVESLPLIASSIMSKKLASGADKILLDVKYGSGALMKTKEDAISLAKLMVKIGNKHGKETIAILSNMNNPLGNMVGNGLEVKESIDILSYRGNKDLKDLCIILASYMVSMGKNIDIKDARQLVIDNLINGNAYKKFIELINSQGGNINNINISNNIVEIKSNKTGYINDIDASRFGMISMKLGAGRTNKDDVIDYGVGIELVKHIGDYVNIGDVIAKVYVRNKTIIDEEVLDAFVIEDVLKQKEPLVLGLIK